MRKGGGGRAASLHVISVARHQSSHPPAINPPTARRKGASKLRSHLRGLTKGHSVVIAIL